MSLENASSAPRNPVKAPTGDVPSTILRDRWKRPFIVTPSGEVETYTRASTIGGVLEDQNGIGIWKQRAVAWAIAHSRSLRMRGAAIPTITESDDKTELGKLADDALDFADTRAAADVGTAIHALTERIDLGLPIPDIEDDRAAIDAYIAATRGKFVFHGTEQFVVCDRFKVAGTFDRLASPLGEMTVTDVNGEPVLDERGEPIVIPAGSRMVWDLKTSGSSKFFGIKFAAQLAAYAHGVRYRGWHTLGEGADPRGFSEDERRGATRGERLDWPDGIAPRTDWALILHVPQGGDTAQLFWVDLTLGYELLRLACDIQAWRKRKDLVVPARPPRVELAPALADGGLRSLIEAVPAGPDAKRAYGELWREHKSRWTPEHTALVERRLAGT